MSPQHIEGVLEVTIRQARGLKDVDVLGKQDPYCIASHGKDQKYQTKVHTDGGKNPVWNETFTFHNATTNLFLKLQFFDKNVMFKDRLIGECKIPLIKAARSRQHDTHIVPVVTRAGVVQGEAHLNMLFTPTETKVRDIEAENEAMRQQLSYRQADSFRDENGLPLPAASKPKPGPDTGSRAGPEAPPAARSAASELSPPTAPRAVPAASAASTPAMGGPGHAHKLSEDLRELQLAADVMRLNEELRANSKLKAIQLAKEAEAAAKEAEIMRLNEDLRLKNKLKRATVISTTTSPRLDDSPSGSASEGSAGAFAVPSAAAAASVAAAALAPAAAAAATTETAVGDDAPAAPPSLSPLVQSMASKALLNARLEAVMEENRRLKEQLQASATAQARAAELAAEQEAKEAAALAEAVTFTYPVLPISDETDAIFNELLEMFRDVDVDESGTISLEEFTQGLRSMGSNLPDADIERLFKESDLNGNGSIDYQEFLTVTVDRTRRECETRLRTAFKHADREGKGKIGREGLWKALPMMGLYDHSAIKAELDKTGDGKEELDLERCLELMWLGMSTQQYLTIASLPPMLED